MKYFLSVLVVAIAMAMPGVIHANGAASMTFDKASYTAERGKQFDVTLSVNPNGESLDTVRAVVTFDPLVLNVSHVRFAGSLNRAAPGNYWDNTLGKLSWGAFTLEEPASSTAPFITVTFLAIQEGEGDIEISGDSRAISNGEEKIDLSNLGKATAQVTASSTAQAGTALIIVESDTQANEVDWYANNSVNFSWKNLQGTSPISAYYYSFDESADTAPSIYLSAKTETLSFKDVKDGIHYFHIKGIQADGKSTAIVHRQINIDVTPPNPIELIAQDKKVLEGESVWLVFATTDDTSGVLQYQIAINDSAYQTQESPLEIVDFKAGTYFFRVGVLDRAGNAAYGSTSVRVYPAGTDLGRAEGHEATRELNAIAQVTQEQKEQEGKKIKLLITFLLGTVAIACIIYVFIKKKSKS